MNEYNEEIIDGMKNSAVEGAFRGPDGIWMFDRRLTIDAVIRMGLQPRTADLNIMGPDIVTIPEELVTQFGLDA